MQIIDRDLSLLIAINDDIATIKDNKKLFYAIFMKLRSFYNLKIAGISILDKNKNAIGTIIGKLDVLANHEGSDNYTMEPMVWFSTFSLDKLSINLHFDNPQIITVDANILFSLQKINTGQPALRDIIKEMSIEAILLVPMQTAGELVGFLIVPAISTPLSSEDQDYLMKIANLIGSALSNAKAYEELRQKEKATEMQLRLLAELVSVQDKDVLYTRLATHIDGLIPCEYLAIHAEHKGSNLAVTISLSKDRNGQFKILPPIRNLAFSLLSLKARMNINDSYRSLEATGEKFESICKESPYFRQLKEKVSIKAAIIMQYSLKDSGELNLVIGRNKPFQWMRMEKQLEVMMFAQDKEIFFAHHEIELGLHILPSIGLILSNVLAFDEIKTLTKKLEQEKNYLLDEINLTHNFQEIIGNSDAIQKTLNKVKQVAPLDATVLIQGETGTGKELIARAVHNLSKRKVNTFITVNCAALPAQLMESELFGHEKGSFTGAVEKRIGKFEVADGGTIFLDEIGELPLEIQAKLLRVLQEKEFERLGGKSTIRSDVRIVAATNRDLEKEVAHGKFRADLFFRLNVFPILVPPLRERKEDIPLLAKYFIEKYSKKIGKNVSSIRKTDLDLLMDYNWPGNIRELEHLTERVIIISSGNNLNFENLFSHDLQKPEQNFELFKTLEEIEKEHIVNALKAANGKVTGENSASQLLGINGKTLGSKMRKFKIKREISISTEEK